MAPSAIDSVEPSPAPGMASDQQQPLPPLPTYPVNEIRFEKYIEPQPEGYQQAQAQGSDRAAIVIDNGSSAIRAGWSFDHNPRINIPPIMARYRDRKIGKTYSFAGYDVYADTNARGHMRNAYEAGTGIIANWDVMEHVLDYIFLKLGIDGSNGSVDMPILMTEAVANLPYSRKSMTEIVFEAYGAPALSYGIDSLFSYNYNNGKTGLVISASHSSTHLIPVYNSKALLTQATRLSWGGSQCAEYLLKLIRLKYPGFPGKLNASQTENMVRDHCYISTEFDNDLSKYLEWTGLEDRDRVIQYPFVEEVIVQKTEEELARIAEKRKESGRRLQEQAAKARLERLVRKEQELDYFRDLQNRIENETKKETRRLLDSEDFKDELALARRIKELEQSIRKSRQKDVGGEEEEPEEPPSYELLDVPDDQLDEAGLKQKRHQRLMKSNQEARARAKAEKEAENARIADEQRQDDERRENDLEGWLAERHAALQAVKQKIKERDRLKADLGNRKSLASQMRMKSIANLASDTPTKKRRRGGDDDTFGANDDDWGVYRQIAINGDGSDDEEEEDLDGGLKNLEAELLKYDPNFTNEHTLDAQRDWSKSLVHAFLRGPRPFDPASQAEAHQLHLNVERIRVPEVFFQPAIAGVDQAGISEIAADILLQRLGSVGVGAGPDAFLKDIFLTGGSALFQGFDERLRRELRCVLPAESELRLRRAADPILDAWKGAARWASQGAGSGKEGKAKCWVTREEYLEKGSDYMKEHDLGNAF